MFPSDIARWALGHNAEEDSNTANSAGDAAASTSAGVPLSEEDMRARRMARLAALENNNTTANSTMEIDKAAVNDAMEVDSPSNTAKLEVKTPSSNNHSSANGSGNNASGASSPLSSEPVSKKQATKLTPAEKLLRKKNLLLKKVLLLSLTEDHHGVNLNLTSLKDHWDQSHIAEILATRLSYEKIDPRLDIARGGGGNDLVGYLSGCYIRAWGEWKEVVGRREKKGCEGEEELEEILAEMKRQVSRFVIF